LADQKNIWVLLDFTSNNDLLLITARKIRVFQKNAEFGAVHPKQPFASLHSSIMTLRCMEFLTVIGFPEL